MILSQESYLRPISEADPCGDALDYDLDFLELEIAARGKPGHEIGESTIAAERPDWNAVARLATELSARTKDLRICVVAVRAALSLEGLAGFAGAIDGLAAIIETFWALVHPQPDADDDSDQTVRLNALSELCDPDGLVGDLRRFSLTQSRVFGTISLLDWTEAQRAASAGSAAPKPDMRTIENSFRETNAEWLAASSVDLAAGLSSIKRIDTAVCSHVGGPERGRFDILSTTLEQMLRVVDQHRPEELEPVIVDAADPANAASPQQQTREIRSRTEIVGMLDRICVWYYANEPASPVPALLERAKGLVAKDFMALLLELAPAGAAQFQSLAGLHADRQQ